MSNYEKLFYPPKKLDTTDTPMAEGELGTLANYAPWGDVVMFYDSFTSASGLFELGQSISGSDHIEKKYLASYKSKKLSRDKTKVFGDGSASYATNSSTYEAMLRNAKAQ